MMSSCQTHSSLIRFSACLGRWLTLCCVHTPQHLLARLLALLPLSGMLMVLIGGARGVFDGLSARQLIRMAPSHCFVIYSVIIITWFAFYGSEMKELVSHLENLERTWCLGCPHWRRRLIIKFTAYWLLSTLALTLWLSFVFVPGRYHHPHYFIDQHIPEVLQSTPGYWTVIGIQILVIFCTCNVVVTFDTIFIVTMDAIRFFLFRMCFEIDRYKSAQCRSMQNFEKKMLDYSNRAASAGSVSQLREETLTQDMETIESLGRSEPGPCPIYDLATNLQHINLIYCKVFRFVELANAFFGTLNFTAHAVTMTILLTGSYMTLMLFNSPAYYGKHVQLAGISVYTLLFFCRVCMWAFSGDDIFTQWRHLLHVVTVLDVEDLGHLAKKNKQQLIDFCSQPLSVSALGFFELRKSNVLSMMSFMLTTFVILLQMTADDSQGRMSDMYSSVNSSNSP